MNSIRRRLLAGLAAAMILGWGALAALVYHEAEHEVQEVFDAHLAQYARVLQSLVTGVAGMAPAPPAISRPPVISAYSEEHPTLGHKYERKLVFRVWSTSGGLLMQSAAAPMIDPPAESGYGAELFDDHDWRTFALVDDTLRVWVAERDDVRGETVDHIVFQQLAPGVLVLPLIAVLVWMVVGRGLSPLKRVAAEVAQRSPAQLAPLTIDKVPEEIRPLTDALNSLFARLRQAFERERRFTADAAHELRTPLAAIKTQAQVALAETDPEARRRALENIVRGSDRASRLETQLLTLARLDPDAQRPVTLARIDVVEVAREVVADATPIALEKDVELALEGTPSAIAPADPELLSVLLRNLVENGVRYTRAGSEVVVTIGVEQSAVRVAVDDAGPGIPETERARVFERFYRMLGTGVSGSGLGLSIVQRIADLHRATVTLGESPQGGLRVELRLPQ